MTFNFSSISSEPPPFFYTEAAGGSRNSVYNICTNRSFKWVWNSVYSISMHHYNILLDRKMHFNILSWL